MMKPTNNTPPTQNDPQQPTDEGLDDAICSAKILIQFDSPEALLEALCVRQFGASPTYDNAHTKALAGTFDIESIEKAFFNHDSDGSESATDQWEKRRADWRSFKAFLATNQKQDSDLPNVKATHGGTPLSPPSCSLDRWIRVILSVSPTGGALRIRDEKSYSPSSLSMETVVELSEMMKAWEANRQSHEMVLYEHGTPSSIKSNRCGTAQPESLGPDKMNLDIGAVGVGVVSSFDIGNGRGVDVGGNAVNGDSDCLHEFSQANVEATHGCKPLSPPSCSASDELRIVLIDELTGEAVKVEIRDGIAGLTGRGAVLDWFCEQVPHFRGLLADSLPYCRDVYVRVPEADLDESRPLRQYQVGRAAATGPGGVGHGYQSPVFYMGSDLD